jgi:hypothetical protein
MRYKPFLRYIIVAVGLAVLILLVRDFNNRMADLRRLTIEQQHISATATVLVQTQTYLETQVVYAGSEDAVADWAYQSGWVKNGDVLVVPLEKDSAQPQEAAEPTPTPQVVSNWQLWYSLFFDKTSP